MKVRNEVCYAMEVKDCETEASAYILNVQPIVSLNSKVPLLSSFRQAKMITGVFVIPVLERPENERGVRKVLKLFTRNLEQLRHRLLSLTKFDGLGSLRRCTLSKSVSIQCGERHSLELSRLICRDCLSTAKVSYREILPGNIAEKHCQKKHCAGGIVDELICS